MSRNMRPYFVRIVHASVRTSVSWYLQRKNVLKELSNKFCRPKIRNISKQKSTEKTLFQDTTATCLGSSGTPWSAPTRAGSSTCRSSTLRSTTRPSTSVRYWVYMILCQIFSCGIYSFVCQKYTISKADFIIKCFFSMIFYILFFISFSSWKRENETYKTTDLKQLNVVSETISTIMPKKGGHCESDIGVFMSRAIFGTARRGDKWPNLVLSATARGR